MLIFYNMMKNTMSFFLEQSCVEREGEWVRAGGRVNLLTINVLWTATFMKRFSRYVCTVCMQITWLVNCSGLLEEDAPSSSVTTTLPGLRGDGFEDSSMTLAVAST